MYNEEKVKELFNKYNIKYNGRRSYSVYLGHANKRNFNENSNNDLETLEKYFIWSENEINKRIKLCEKYNKIYSIKQWENYKLLARRYGFYNKDNYIMVNNYFEYDKNIRENHKNICNKYNKIYDNEYCWENYVKVANKNGFYGENCVEEYFKNENNIIKKKNDEYKEIKRKEQEKIDNERRKIFEKYNKIYKNYCTLINVSKKAYRVYKIKIKDLFDLEKYFIFLQFIEKLEKQELQNLDNKRKELMLKYYGKCDMDWGRIMSNVRAAGFKSDNEFKDFIDWQENVIIPYKLKNKKEKEKKEKDIKLLNKYGFSKSYIGNFEKNANKKNMTFEEYMGTFVWCDHCQQYEDPDFNSISNHWEEKDKNEFFIYRIWKDDHSEDVSFLESNIVGFDKLLDNKIHCGIYRWYIDSIPFYYGQSINILRRSHEHFINIVDSSEYWLNIYEEMKNNNDNNNISINKIHTLSIDFVECNENELDSLEKKLILRDKPMTQICTNDNKYDNIIPLNQRNFNLENLKDKYEERIKYY